MIALYRSERQADALRAYQNARTLLGEELGIEPSRRLQALEEKILLQDPSISGPEVQPSPNTTALERNPYKGLRPSRIPPLTVFRRRPSGAHSC